MAGRSADDLSRDPIVRAAFERFMEIVSDASRHVPAELKAMHPQIPWTEIAHFGNQLRHAYDRIDAGILWDTYMNDLGPLDMAASDLLAGLRDRA